MVKNNRLDEIVKYLNKNEVLLDIGCDHGYVIKKAIDNNIIVKAIASDISENALKQAKTNLTDYNVKFVLSNGFENIKDNYKQVVIAGMGSNTIIDILNNSKKVNDITYILQANDRHHTLRKYLSDNNLKIIDEKVIYDDFYYIIMKVIRGNHKLTQNEIYLGPKLIKKKDSYTYYMHKKNYIDELLLKHGKISSNMLEKYEAYKYALIQLEGNKKT